MASVADLRNHIDLAAQAIIDGAYAIARKRLMAAEAVLASLPESTSESFSQKWSSRIDNLLRRLREEEAGDSSSARSGIQQSKIVYTCPTGGSGGSE